MPVQGGRRRMASRQPNVKQVDRDRALINYNAMGTTVTSSALGNAVYRRFYCPGFGVDLLQSGGPTICSYYNTGVFKPGTSIKWCPSVSFTTSGRWFVGFVDNPEQMVSITGLYDAYISVPNALNYAAYAQAVKGLGSCISFPVWQETEITFPTRLRRKRFDVNLSQTLNVDIYERSNQMYMVTAFEGGPLAATTLGHFEYHDVVDVEGVSAVAT